MNEKVKDAIEACCLVATVAGWLMLLYLGCVILN